MATKAHPSQQTNRSSRTDPKKGHIIVTKATSARGTTTRDHNGPSLRISEHYPRHHIQHFKDHPQYPGIISRMIGVTTVDFLITWGETAPPLGFTIDQMSFATTTIGGGM